MIVDGATGIRNIGAYVRDSLMPQVADQFLATDLRLIAQHFDLIAEEFDRAADDLMRERAALVSFFEAAIPHLAGDVRNAAKIALEDAVDGFIVSDLRARADRDLSTFIAAHAQIDVAHRAGEPWAPALHEEAWRFLDGRLERGRYFTVG